MSRSNGSARQVVGRSVTRLEGEEKVTGKALFADDLVANGCLYGRTVRSGIPRGLIREIRFGPEIPWEEFVVVLPRDIPGRNVSRLIDDRQPVLAHEEIRHPGEALALVAHARPEMAARALQCIEIDADPLPAVFSIAEARRGETIQFGKDNLFQSLQVEDGDPEGGFAEADLILDHTYRTGPQEQLYIEPQSMWAQATPGGEIRVWGSMQCPFFVQKALAPLFGVDSDRIRVIHTETGGAFGGKEDYPNLIAAHAALLSWKAGGRAVKMVYDRREDLSCTTKRHPSQTRIRAGLRRDGRLLALDIDFNLDGGAYPTLSSVVLSRGMLHSWGPYRCPNTRVRARAWMTNNIPFGAFRGFGAPQSIFALELHLSRCAGALGIDPAELRRRNLLRSGDRMPTGQVIEEAIDLESLMEKAMEKSDYRRKSKLYRKKQERGAPRRGIGISVFFHGAGFTGSGEVLLASELEVELSQTGGLRVLAANVEYGQGTKTTFAQIAAQTCTIPPQWVEIVTPDTALVPNSGPTVASRTTMVCGGLLERACRKLLGRLAHAGGLPDDHTPLQFRRAAQDFLSRHGELKVRVRYQPPPGIQWDDQTYKGDAYAAYAWSCDVAEVELDPVDYTARVTHFVSAVECGRVINPVLARGQIQGGVAQGIGFALYENCVMQEGAMLNATHTNYIIPTSADTPHIEVEFVDFSDPAGSPKGIGELPISGPAPAIAAALSQALGDRCVPCLPLLPEQIMRVACQEPEHE